MPIVIDKQFAGGTGRQRTRSAQEEMDRKRREAERRSRNRK